MNIYAATCRQGQGLGNVIRQSGVSDGSFFNVRDDVKIRPGLSFFTFSFFHEIEPNSVKLNNTCISRYQNSKFNDQFKN